MRPTESYITNYCHIKNMTIAVNGKSIFKSEDAKGFKTFSKLAYKALELVYPKFFKMDNLSRLAFLAGDILLKEELLETGNREDIAIVLSNRAASLDTDRNHQESIQDRNHSFPSPAIFVYTLPNICIGEISIKHKLHSENSFFIFDSFNPVYLSDYSNSLLRTKKAEKVLCGWVDFDKDIYQAFFYIVAKQGSIIHNSEEIKRLYLTSWEI